MPRAMKFICALAFLALPAVTHAQAAGTGAEKRAEMKQERKEERKEGKKEGHPELRAAMTALERSKKDLEKTANDYGGHKAEAIKSIDEAIKHLKLAEAYDKK